MVDGGGGYRGGGQRWWGIGVRRRGDMHKDHWDTVLWGSISFHVHGAMAR